MPESLLKIPATDGIECSGRHVFFIIVQGYPTILCIPIKINAKQSIENENEKLH